MTLATSLPWYFWVLWGVIGVFLILRWVIKSTKNDPIIWRSGWVLGSVILIIVIIDNLGALPLIGGTSSYSEYLLIMDRLSIPLVMLMVSLIFVGGYQKSLRPDFDPEKRRMAIICMYGLVVTVICLGLVFGGFYIYDNFFRG